MARRFTRVTSGRRQSLWVGAEVTNASMAASVSVLLATLNAAALALRPFTIVRTRLVIHFESDQQAASEFVQAVFSTQVVTAPAAAAGITAVPTPITDTDSDFVVYQPLFSRFRIQSTVGMFQNGQDTSWLVDSKAMRKVSPDDDVAFVVENGSAFAANIAIEGRFLIKLH